MTTGRFSRRGAAAAAVGALGVALVAGSASAAMPVDSAAALVQRAQGELAAHSGRAILDYERARLLAPRAPEVREGLARAQAAAGLPPASPRLLDRAAGRLSPDEWSRLALGALALAAIAAGAAAWRVRRRWTGPIAAVGLAVALSAGAVAWRTAPLRSDAVVVGANTIARIAPFAQADEAFVVPEGSQVTIQATHEGFARVESDRGTGWVPTSAVESIISGS